MYGSMWTLNVMSATSSLFNVKIHRDSRYLVLRRDDSPHVTIKDVPDLILAPDDTPRVPRQHVNTALSLRTGNLCSRLQYGLSEVGA